MYTPSPLNDTTGAGVESVVMEDDLVSKLSDDFSSTDNRDVTEIDEDLNLGQFCFYVRFKFVIIMWLHNSRFRY